MEKSSYSKIIALLFSIVNFLWFLPGAFFLLLYCTIFPRQGFSSAYHRIPELLQTTEGITKLVGAMCPFLVFFIGCSLWGGSILHLAGKLKSKFLPFLWTGTILFNIPVPIFAIYLITQKPNELADFGSPAITFILLVIWTALSCILSAIALKKHFSEIRQVVELK